LRVVTFQPRGEEFTVPVASVLEFDVEPGDRSTTDYDASPPA
jgi:hypothetical protein